MLLNLTWKNKYGKGHSHYNPGVSFERSIGRFNKKTFGPIINELGQVLAPFLKLLLFISLCQRYLWNTDFPWKSFLRLLTKFSLSEERHIVLQEINVLFILPIQKSLLRCRFYGFITVFLSKVAKSCISQKFPLIKLKVLVEINFGITWLQK